MAGISYITSNMKEIAGTSEIKKEGVFSKSSKTGETYGKGGTYPTNMESIYFDASQSNAIYGKSSTVKPAAVKTLII